MQENASRQPVIIAYIPVVHEGYLRLFREYPENTAVYVMGPELIALEEYLVRKDIRALRPSQIVTSINALWGNDEPKAHELTDHGMRTLAERAQCGEIELVMPDEDISRAVAQKYMGDGPVTWRNIFLRYDRTATLAKEEVPPDRVVDPDGFHGEMIRNALREAERSPDWWRQVGGVLVQDDTLLLSAFNSHALNQQIAYIMGDPRAAFKRGLAIELSLADHAEATLISEAARRGLATQGASLYVTTFTCPPCAKLVARAGISHLYYATGYAMLDGTEVLKAAGVELVRVNGFQPVAPS